MPNIRMFALAGAMLLLIPVGVLAGPQSDVYEVAAEIEAQVSNLHILDPAVNGTPINAGVMHEQLVEGHTTFVTIDVVVNGTEVRGNVTVDGYVHCEGQTSLDYSWWGGIPYPTSFGGGLGECRVGGRVVITPTLYCTVVGDFQCSANNTNLPLMQPTGNVYPFTSPTSESAYVEEYSFQRTTDDGFGGLVTTTYYAWATPILMPWVNEQGEAQNMIVPIPGERLDAMKDVDHYRVLYEDKVRKES